MTKVIGQTTGLPIDGKACTKCSEWKLLDQYYTRVRKSGFVSVYSHCKTCHHAENEARRQLNLADDLEKKRARYRENPSAATERVRQWRLIPGNMERKNAGERARRKSPEVKEKIREYDREYRLRPEVNARLNANRRQKRHTDEIHRAKLLAEQREYYSRPEIKERDRAKRQANKPSREAIDKFNARRRERYAEDPLFLCSVQCRAMVSRLCKKAKVQKLESTAKSLGYTALELKQRLECQFRPGMSWENFGEWHVDHKKPIARFIQQGITDAHIINALANLQPLWAEENMMKSDTMPDIPSLKKVA